MFIRKMLQSDWLDYRAWTIYTFPYVYTIYTALDLSGPFTRLFIKVKTQDFWEDRRETIDRGRKKLVTFGKLSVNFRKLSGKTEAIDYYIFSRVFHQFTFGTKFPEHVLNISVRQ